MSDIPVNADRDPGPITASERFVVLVIASGEHLTVTGTSRGRLYTTRATAEHTAQAIERKHPLWRATVLQLFPKGAEEL